MGKPSWRWKLTEFGGFSVLSISKQCPIVLFTGSQVVSVDIMLTVIASHCPALKGSNFMTLLSVGVLTTATCEVQDINEVNPVLWNYNAVDCVKLSLWQALEV